MKRIYILLFAMSLFSCAHSQKQEAQSQQDDSFVIEDFDAQQTEDMEYQEQDAGQQTNKYREDRSIRTISIDKNAVNEVKGVILHHTAEPTVQRSLAILSGKEKKVGVQCCIDTDGTRYVLCEPTTVTYHAGLSTLNGRDSCNYFTIGIEFQGNTLEKPLTKEQIESGIEYLLPIIEKYNIPISNIVTHQFVREAYMKKHPEKKCYGKVDITPAEYKKFMAALKQRLNIK